ncbi:unnamed protein product [Acanthoscelides obtectus]|uniref:Multiprotein bridging factor 1 N-terminal domain-containing protein n=1 Tax=Acanthoscelides obtectus TaxID=200917 RepID=A0A9P0QGU4_ACAOB|nr:unnamed protein product [Acanthoscelides obtectus]CAK1683324.1 Endothelial differentiation-related factor 1 homolog [Acanthoscelides obtectus]
MPTTPPRESHKLPVEMNLRLQQEISPSPTLLGSSSLHAMEKDHLPPQPICHKAWPQVLLPGVLGMLIVNWFPEIGMADAEPSNKQHVTTKNTAKLDRETEELKHETIPLDVGKLIQQGRQAKGLRQKDLATKINEKPQGARHFKKRSEKDLAFQITTILEITSDDHDAIAEIATKQWTESTYRRTKNRGDLAKEVRRSAIAVPTPDFARKERIKKSLEFVFTGTNIQVRLQTPTEDQAKSANIKGAATKYKEGKRDMKYLRAVKGVARKDKIRNEVIREELGVESVLQRIEDNQLKWFGHLVRMKDTRPVKLIWEASVQQKTARGRPKKTWKDGLAKILKNRGISWNEAVG